MAKTFNHKEKGIAFGLTLLGFILCAGLQHFYLGRIFRGLLWFFTAGLFFIGTIYDLFTIGRQVERVNRQL